MATSVQSEDTVFVLDTSASMYRNDHGDGPRLHQGFRAIEQIVRKKNKIDAKDRFQLVMFAKKVKIQPDMVFTAEEILPFLQAEAEFEHQSALGDGLAAAVQQLLKQMRFIGQKLGRIIVISDGLAQNSERNPLSVAKIAMQLGIVIDVIRFGPARVPGNILKKLCELTGGDYIYVASAPELDIAIERLANKKEKKHNTLFDKNDENDIMAMELLAEIAAEPLRIEDLTEEQKQQAIYGLEKGKNIVCTICYSNTCMVDKIDFFGCGRFCPNCLTPFHFHCAQMWAEQQNSKGGALKPKQLTFRCPHCFYLMKVPKTEIEKSGNEADYGHSHKLRHISSSQLLEDTLCNAPDCGVLISKDKSEPVYECTACHSVFHVDCAQGYVMKNNRCPYCNQPVQIEDI